MSGKKKAPKKVGILLGPSPPEPVWQWRSNHVGDEAPEPDRPAPAILSDDELLDRALDLGLHLPEQIEAYVRGVRDAEDSAAPVPVAPELLEREDEDLAIQPDLVP